MFVASVPTGTPFDNLSILPTCGTKFYRYSGEWTEDLLRGFHPEEKTKIIASLNKAIAESAVKVDKLWGEAN